MGGEHSGVSATTRDVFLESAFFDQIAVAGKARSYGLHTDASHRYERGVDWNWPVKPWSAPPACCWKSPAVKLARLPKLSTSSTCRRLRQSPARCAYRADARPGDRLGSEIEQSAQWPGPDISADGEGQWRVEVPSHRFDISLEVDLIEELARLYGYNRLPVRYPQARLAPQPKAEAAVTCRSCVVCW
jgi:phenylalanyl-tRNA synthetase beta chain